MSSATRLLIARSIRARPLRALLTALAVALGTATVLGVQVAETALHDQASDAAAQRAGTSQLDVRALSGAGLSVEELDAIRSTPGVALVAPLEEKRDAARVSAADVDAVTVTIVVVDAQGDAALRPIALQQGRLPAASSTDEVALDTGVVDQLAATAGRRPSIGDTIQLTTATGPDRFTVVGLTAGTSGGAAFTRSAAFVSPAAASGALRLGLRRPLAALRLAGGVSVASVASTLEQRLGPVVITSDPTAGATDPLGQLHPLLVLAVILSLCVGAGVTANSVALATLERRREIGLLRAAGASRRQVIWGLLGEAGVEAVAGALVGLGGGVLLGALLIHGFSASDLPVPSGSPGALTLLAAFAAALASALAGAAVPAIVAARPSPLEGLRARPSGSREPLQRVLLLVSPLLLAAGVASVLRSGTAAIAVGAFLILAAIVIAIPVFAPALLRGLAGALGRFVPATSFAAANLARRRNRTALTLGGLCVAVGAATASSALSDGALAAGDGWISHLFAGDLVIVSPATAPDAVAAQLASSSGVAVGRLRFLSAAIDGELLGMTAVDVARYRDGAGLQIIDGDRTAAFHDIDTGTAIVAPQVLADAAGWHVGSVVQLGVAANGDRPVDLRIAAVAAHTFPSGDGRESLVIGRTAAEQLFGDQASGFDDLDVSAGSAMPAVESAAARYGLQALTIGDLQAAARRSLGHSLGILSAVAWVAVIAAMLAVATTLAVNVRQGRRELALLRAVGLGRREAMRMLVAEAILLGVAGTLVGLVAGFAVAVPLLRAAASPGFDPQLGIPWAPILAAAVTVVAGSAAAVLAPARAALRSSVARELHHE